MPSPRRERARVVRRKANGRSGGGGRRQMYQPAPWASSLLQLLQAPLQPVCARCGSLLCSLGCERRKATQPCYARRDGRELSTRHVGAVHSISPKDAASGHLTAHRECGKLNPCQSLPLGALRLLASRELDHRCAFDAQKCCAEPMRPEPLSLARARGAGSLPRPRAAALLPANG